MIERLEARQLLSAELRINSGGGTLIDTEGHQWIADKYFRDGVAKKWSFAVSGTTTPALLTDRRSGSAFRYVVPLDAGDYRVTLLAADPFFTAPGQRILDVYAQDKKVISRLDLVASAGPKTLVQRSFTVHVGTYLTLRFVGVVDEAMVGAIDIVPLPDLTPVPAAPLVPAASWNSSRHIIVDWLAGSADATGYQIQRQVDGARFITLGTAPANTPGFEDTTVTPGHHYVYRVYAFNKAGMSHGSASVSPTTDLPPTAPTPFHGSPIALPATIQFEDFDEGGDGISYHDETIAFNGRSAPAPWSLNYRSTPVDLSPIRASPGNYAITYTSKGDWVVYTVYAPVTGTYRIVTHASTFSADASIHFDVDAKRITQSIHLTQTGSDKDYADTVTQLQLTKGAHLLQVVMETGGDNFDWMRVEPITTATAKALALSSAKPNSNQIKTQSTHAIDLVESRDDLTF